jgi:HK97 family phage portal protein
MIFDRIFRAATPENPRFDLNSPEAWDVLGAGNPTDSGERMSRDKALGYAPWFRGINLVSSTVGKLPVQVHKYQSNGKVLDRRHWAWRLMRRKPNSRLTAFHWKKTMVAHALQEGNGYSYIFRLGDGMPEEMLILDPKVTGPIVVDGELWYVTTVAGEQRKLPASDVFHVRGLSFDGLSGYSVWEKARESLGLGMAARKFGAVFFKNNARPNLAVKIAQRYDETVAKQIKESWESIRAGLDNQHRIALLWAGQDLATFSIDADKAQLLETRKFETKEIALFIGVPPHKLGDSDRHGYNSLEQENQDYLDEGLDPWLVAIEEEAWDKLLTEEEKAQESHEILFDRKKLVRADSAARSAYFQKATGNRAWMTPDEARDDEDLPLQGGDAATLKDPPGVTAPPTDAPAEPPKPPARGNDRAALAEMIRADVVRMTRRLGQSAIAAAKKPGTFLQWLDTIMAEHLGVVKTALAPAERLAGGIDLGGVMLLNIRENLLALSGECKPAELAAAVERRMQTIEDVLVETITHAALGDHHVGRGH